MSDVMLLGILRMPYDMAMGGEISRHQYHSCGKEAAERIQADADELARLRAEVERLTAALADERRHADALADTLYSMDGLQSIDCEMRDNAVQQHRARRQG